MNMDINKIVVFDIEAFPNYFLVSFKHIKSGKVLPFELRGTSASISDADKAKIQNIFQKRVLSGYNSNNYDIPMLLSYLNGKNVAYLKKLSDAIVASSDPGWMIMKRFNIPQNRMLNQIDLMEPSPGVRISLKLYGARMHTKKLQDLPYPPDKELTEKEMDDVLSYCENDLDTTIDLFNRMTEALELREQIGAEYKADVMSKSDGQIAELIFKKRLSRSHKPTKVEDKIKYDPPSYLKFRDPQLLEVLDFVKNHEFELDGKGSVKLPTKLKSMKIKLGHSVYRIGIGGLHSSESAQCIIPNENQILMDRDVTSYYPSIIIKRRLFPKHLGSNFLNVYENMFKERAQAKREGNMLISDSLKLALNSVFGKLGSKWSFLYSPDLMLNVTLTGQLCLLWLIEALERNNVKVVSANTDGFVSLLDKQNKEVFDKICQNWEKATGFNLEDNHYKALYSRDVNNYLAVTTNGKAKGKGIFADVGLRKNPAANICVKAVQDYLVQNKPIEQTIQEEQHPGSFIHARTVKGGAVWRGEYLGKVVRWVYTKTGENIFYQSNGNRVPLSDGATPMMTITELPKDLDRKRYIDDAYKILESLGLERNAS